MVIFLVIQNIRVKQGNRDNMHRSLVNCGTKYRPTEQDICKLQAKNVI